MPLLSWYLLIMIMLWDRSTSFVAERGRRDVFRPPARDRIANDAICSHDTNDTIKTKPKTELYGNLTNVTVLRYVVLYRTLLYGTAPVRTVRHCTGERSLQHARHPYRPTYISTRVLYVEVRPPQRTCHTLVPVVILYSTVRYYLQHFL